MSWAYWENPRVDHFTIGQGKYAWSRDNAPTECRNCGRKLKAGDEAYGDHRGGFVYCSKECFPKDEVPKSKKLELELQKSDPNKLYLGNHVADGNAGDMEILVSDCGDRLSFTLGEKVYHISYRDLFKALYLMEKK